VGTSAPSTVLKWYGKRVYDQYRKDAYRAVLAATKFLTEKIKENTSIPGRAIGHPYARAHRGGSYNAPTPWMVHKPGSGLRVRPVWVKDMGDEVLGKAGLHNTRLNRMIVYGTSRMRPRNVVWKTTGQYKGEIQKILRTILKGKGHQR